MSRESLLVLLALVCLAPLGAAQVPSCAPHECVQVVPPLDLPIIHGDVEVRSFTLSVEVVDGIATVRQTIEVENNGLLATQLQANLPLAPGAAVLAFNLTVGGVVYDGIVKERAQAAAEYEQARNESRDALLLSRPDPRALQLSANVGPGEPRILQVASVALVPTAAGARVLRVPTSLLPDAGSIDVSLSIADRFGLVGVTFPEAPLQVLAATPQRIEASLHAQGQIEDVVAVWTEDTREWDVRVLASHDGPDAALLVRIDHHPAGGAVLPRDVAFVLDRSGSMSGQKILDAREALATGLGMLRSGDRFTLHTFDTEIGALMAEPSGTGSVASMQTAVRGVTANGGTDLHAGLLAGLASLPREPGRVAAVVLLSDGLPTAGVQDHAQILDEAVAAAAGAAVHVVAIGIDADRTFLRDVAEATGGSLTTLEPSDGELEARLAQLFAELDRPVARDVQVTFEGFEPRFVMPPTIPVLYEGRTATLLLRGDLPPAWTIRLEATGPAGTVDETLAVVAADVEIVPAVEQLWGAARVEALLAQERAQGRSQELTDQIVAAAIQYGVVTMHTSWVVVGPPSAVVPDPAFADAAYRIGGGSGGAAAATGTGFGTGTSAMDAGSTDEPATPAPGVVPLLVVLGLAALAAGARRRSPPF